MTMRVNAIAVIALALSLGLSAVATAQKERHETARLKNGQRITGVASLEAKRLVMEHKAGKGSVRQSFAFAQVEPHSLYGIALAVLSPLEPEEHAQLADLCFDSGLFLASTRHYRKSVTDPKKVPSRIMGRIEEAEKKDLAQRLDRSRKEMKVEKFRRARRIALGALSRYSKRPEAKSIHTLIAEISKRDAAAEKRRRSLERSRMRKAEWEQIAKKIEVVEKWIGKAQRAERKGLSVGGSLRRQKNYYDSSIRYLDSADRQSGALVRNRTIPEALANRLALANETVIDMQIRLRLHIASLYTVRGSFGSAVAFVNSALAIDPTDATALAARGRVEQAAAAASARGGGAR